jgi:putative DNA-invertase from lambdoid prophage Rac
MKRILPAMNVALYVLISTSDQNASMQEEELRTYCARRALKVVAEYQDTMSGAKDSRPALQRLLGGARARKFDAVVVWKIDRFGRSLRHLVNTLADLEALGVAFISLRDSLDFTTPSGKLQFHVLAAVAEFERYLISERVRAGMKTAIRRGKRCGRPRTRVEADRVRALRAAGASWTEIAMDLGVPRTVCQRAVRKLAAIGRP